jgi:outer membrane protein, heavy metal efflux system
MRALILTTTLLTACATSPYDRAWVSDRVARATGHATRASAEGDRAARVPDRVTLDDGLTEDEAVATALWNNAAFQADLTQLGFTRADLADAGLLPNPTLSLLLPIGPRQIEAWLAWPIEVLWQRPGRVAAARLDVQRVAESLVQSGLDLARDARLAHADAVLALARRDLRAENLRVVDGLRELTQTRLRAGDVSEPEAAALDVEHGVAQEQAARAEAEATVALARLTLSLGLDPAQPTPRPVAGPVLDAAPALDGLVRVALAARPDVRAAEIAMEAAGARRGWERARVFGVVARVDGFGPGPGVDSATARLGAQITLPIFNQNQGGITRADAEIERATWRYAQVRQQVVADVVTARAQLAQAVASLAPWRERVLPAAEASLRGATEAYERGESAYLAVLDATRRRIDAQVRAVELEAEARRAAAQLERSTGGRRVDR